MDGAVFSKSRLLHVVNVFIAGNGAASEGAVADGFQQNPVLSGFQASFYEVTHR
jgi:hypothetical protein